MCTGFWWKSQMESDQSEDRSIDGRMGLMDSPCSGYGPVVGSGECSDEPLGSGITELVTYFYLHEDEHFYMRMEK
jgi:hypothetical protein